MRVRAREEVVDVTRVYDVEVERDGRVWLVRVPDLDRVTQALHYREVPEMAKELIEIMDGAPRHEVELRTTVRLPPAIEDRIGRAKALQGEAESLRKRAAEEHREAVRELVAAVGSQREAGDVLGIGKQRVHQLINS